MAETIESPTLATKRCAVVTGANKGIGLEICRQLASKGVLVVLTARDEKKGLQAVENLKATGLCNVIFHQLDVMDPSSIASLGDFVKSHFGKLDILVNNAGISGAIVDFDAFLKLLTIERIDEKPNWKEVVISETYELTEECLQTNYYGAKRLSEALIPLLQLSDSARIVNVSSSMGKLQHISHERAKEVLSDIDGITEEKVDEVINEFLKDFREGSLESRGWPSLSAYIVSKAALNAYTRILAKKLPNFCINCVCPGFVKTDINENTGVLTVEEGAVRLALLPDGGPSGLFFSHQKEEIFGYNPPEKIIGMAETIESPTVATKRCAVVTGANKGIGLEICRQLASKGVLVVLTARDEKKGLQAVENLKATGLCNVIFHQLDVMDPSSIASLGDFVKSHFGKLDILVNNAGIGGAIVDFDALPKLLSIETKGEKPNWKEIVISETYELTEECLQTNYYGAKRLSEALIPLLQLSDSARIVNVSSSMGKLQGIFHERAKEVLSDIDGITEEKVDEVINEFLKDFREGSLESRGWPSLSAYIVSKAALNAYTRILAKKLPNFCINCVCPGFVKTDINGNTGVLTVEEGAESAVRLALLPDGGPSGLFFSRKEPSSF
uniref:(+)-neomenthol dehydrogenase-like n=1 Tax=Nelumbo nucifera TaxID=4432 RepID=A0A822ZX77_NELNU|nr:TPA_asm: hypothetical protein HUJ06_017393 [Nelumbo nucifera]